MDGNSSWYIQLFDDDKGASTAHSEANVDAPVPATIFLSHSGKQKHFVEDLFNALKNVNHTESTVFFDKHCLPKGSPFPDYIRKAALGCSLGVVILSEDFMTSKWPMLELEMLVLCKGPNVKVLPVCYELNFEDLKSSSNISKWQKEWSKIEDGKHVHIWEEAVRALALFNGEVYQPNTSVTAYIKKVVRHICNLVPCPVPHDMSVIQGHQRLSEEIARMFDVVKASFSEESTCMLGLYGVAGSGKTILCKSMVNYYTSKYLGRSYLIEFPSDGDKSKIVKACKKALRRLINLDKELLLDKVNSFEEVIGLMKRQVKAYDVFLAIDNVSERCWEEAKGLLRVGFSATSKILLTSRNEQVLMEVLIQHNTTRINHVKRLPTPDHEEAFQIFQETLDLGNLCSLRARDQIDILLAERCSRSSGQYHPLALKALAQFVKTKCTLEDLENWKQYHLHVVLEEIRRKPGLQTFDDVVKLGYDNLLGIKKHIFLDIVLFIFPKQSRMLQVNALESHPLQDICWWISFLYKDVPETHIRRLIEDLALDGFIRIEAGKYGIEKRVTAHDLYLDLAQQEAANSSRLFVSGYSSRSWEEIEWGRLETVSIWQSDGTCFFEKVRNKNLDCMPSLRVLALSRVTSMRRCWALSFIFGFLSSSFWFSVIELYFFF